MRRRGKLEVGVMTLGGILLIFMPALSDIRFLKGCNDFVVFYSGSRLFLSDRLHDSGALRDDFVRTTKMPIPEPQDASVLVFVRPPWYAMLLRPLSALPYRMAYKLWIGLLIASIVGFCRLWPYRDTAILASLSIPLAAALVAGQDAPILLFFIALMLYYYRQGRHLLAGAIMAFCVASKPHLFMLLPILIWRREMWAYGKGLLAVASALTLACFINGIGWPLRYYRDVVTNGSISPGLPASLAALPLQVCIALSLCVVYLTWVLLQDRNLTTEEGFGIVLIGGLLLAPHSYIYDHTLILAAATPFYALRTGIIRIASFLLLVPPLHYLAVMETPLPKTIPLVLFVWFGILATGAIASRAKAAPPLGVRVKRDVP